MLPERHKDNAIQICWGISFLLIFELKWLALVLINLIRHISQELPKYIDYNRKVGLKLVREI